jgi:hypothetical protein
LAPPATESEIAAVAAKAGGSLPSELHSLLLYCQGFAGIMECDFTGRLFFELAEIFPHGLPIVADGFGNFWVIDLLGNDSQETAVFYACHDPPVIVYQADSLGRFVEQLIQFGKHQLNSTIDDVHERHAMNIWKNNPSVLSWEAASGGDQQLGAFAQTLDQSYQFVDLRHPEVGHGFSWGRYGADTAVKRFGLQRIFAYQKKELTWLQKVFGV